VPVLRRLLYLASALVAPLLLAILWPASKLPWLPDRPRAFLGRAASRVRRRVFGDGRPIHRTTSQLYAGARESFEHALPPAALGLPTAARPHDVMIVDDFYEDPDAVRRFALTLDYVEYMKNWYSSALEEFPNPLKGRGVRLANAEIQRRLSTLVHAEVDPETWDTSGDGWNGAFHYKTLPMFAWEGGSKIHNHTGRDSDVRNGWSALVYLSPDPPRHSGTTVWRDRRTNKAFSLDSVYEGDLSRYEMVLEVENVYNRLVLFYASVFHMGERGWGSNVHDARLFQTFFFNVR